MMDRADRTGMGVAVVGHAILFGLLSLSFLWSQNVPKPKVQPIDVSLVDDVAVEAAAPEAAEQPAQSRAPEAGPPEDAPPPAPEEVAQPEPAPEPKPAPPQPKPEPAPQPKPAPQKPAPAPKPAAKPVPKPVQPTAAKPEQPRTPPKPVAKPAPARATAPAKPTVAAARPAAKPGTARSTGSNPQATAKPKPRGSRLGDNFLQGLTADPSTSTSQKPMAAKMSSQAAASIGAAIKRQVQPCADRQVNPGPGASDILVTIRLRLNRDGSLNGRPTFAAAPRGVTDSNERYVDAVNRNAISAFVGCAPLKGLPQELYDVPNGWADFRLTYKLPD